MPTGDIQPTEGTDELYIAYDASRQELILETPPIDVPAGMHHNGAQPDTRVGIVPLSGWIKGYDVDVVDGAGNAVPRELLHHVNVIAPGQRELFSPIMLRIGAAGTETGSVRVPGIFGFPVDRGSRIMVTAMLHNPFEQTYHDVRIRVRMPVSERGGIVDPMRVYPFYLDVMPPASVHRFDLPPGHFEKSWQGRPAVDGRIMGMGGHLHEYGTELRLEDVTEGRVMWRTTPVLDESGDVAAMSHDRFIWRLGLPIRADHTYRLTAVYDNPTGTTIAEGGMGALGGIVMPARNVVWPSVDTTDPQYTLDNELVYRGGMDDGMVMDMKAKTGSNGAHRH